MRLPAFKKYLPPLLLVLSLLLPAASFAANETSPATDLPATLYIIPFLNVMIPAGVSSELFDVFIDEMLVVGESHGMSVRIVKQNIDTVDREWLGRQTFVTGEVFGYVEESGCCSTQINAKVRAYLYRPGSNEPDRELVVPGDVFFEHDLSSLEKERALLASRMAKALATGLFANLSTANNQ